MELVEMNQPNRDKWTKFIFGFILFNGLVLNQRLFSLLILNTQYISEKLVLMACQLIQVREEHSYLHFWGSLSFDKI